MIWAFLWRLPMLLLMLVLALVLAPVLPLFAIGQQHLPDWLRWFDTPDNPLDGDDGYRLLHAPYPGAMAGWGCYVNRVFWLWRNPSYGFDQDVLAITTLKTDTLQVEGDPLTSNIPGHSGLCVRRLWRFDGETRAQVLIAWQWYWVRRWGASAYCIRVNLGWKLWNPLGTPATFVCSINPFMGYEP